MDTTAIIIIVISTVTAVYFKWFIFKRIRQWIDRDLINGLAGGDSAKLTYLEAQLEQLKSQGVKRSEYQERLSRLAEQFEQSN